MYRAQGCRSTEDSCRSCAKAYYFVCRRFSDSGCSSAETQTIVSFLNVRLPKCRLLNGLLKIVCCMIASWEQPTADDLGKLSVTSANSDRICIRFNNNPRIICELQSERRIQAAYEIYVLAVSSAFRQTFAFEMPECLHLGRRMDIYMNHLPRRSDSVFVSVRIGRRTR